MKRFIGRGNAGKAFAKFSRAILLTLSTLIFTTAGMADELVVNGGFEEPSLNSPDFGPLSRAKLKNWTTMFGENYVLPCDTTGGAPCDYDGDGNLIIVPGWDVWWTNTLPPPVGDGSMEPGRLEIRNNDMATDPNNHPQPWPLAPRAKFGFQAAELDSHDRPDGQDNAVIQQTLLTCPDYRYEFSYWWKSRKELSGDNDTRVVMGDTRVRVNMLNDGWQKETILFVADHYETEVAFASIGMATEYGMFLDEISVKGREGGNKAACSCEGYTDDDSSDDNGGEGYADDSSADGSASCWNAVDDDSSEGDDDHTYNHMYTDLRAEICSFGEDLKSLTFLYDGNNTTDFTNSTLVSMVPSELDSWPPDLPLFPWPESAHFRFFDFDSGTELAAGNLQVGELIKVNGLENTDTLEIMITETNDASKLLQTIVLDTECFEPLVELDEFGGVTLWSGETY